MLFTMLPARAQAAATHLTCSPSSVRYGNVSVGQTKTLLITVTNSNQTSVTILRASASNSKFKISNFKLPQVLTAGKSVVASVTFAPTATGTVSGQVVFTSNVVSQKATIEMGGTGVIRGAVTASPASVSFGEVYLGSSSTLPVVLTNTRPWKVTLESLRTTGSAFSVSGASFPLTLAVGQSVRLDATFKPQRLGQIGGSSFIFGPALNLPLRGTGASKPRLTISPATLGFGSVGVGTTETRTIDLSATDGSVTISSAASSGSPFAVPGVGFPLTIPAGQVVSLDVTFTPQRGGTASATLRFSSDAANSPTYAALAGTGTPPHVTLSWVASTSPDVAGYNIYRKTSSAGSYARINAVLDPDTSYTDATVIVGTTYYYATVAVTASGKESRFSNQVEVVVP
ncbi:MAG: choice-of-anchor D domain-containing protein [Candidatus Sulfotelmatobacter sp.]